MIPHGRLLFQKIINEKDKEIMSEKTKNKIPVLDVRGEICPYPMLKTNEELDDNLPGVEVLDVLTDHSPALSTIPPQAMKRGYEVDIEEIGDGQWKIRLSRPE